MRRATLAALVLAMAAGGGTVARATPLACADPCPILATAGGYVPALMEIASGTTVHWTSTDTSHPTTDDSFEPCFTAPSGPGTTLVPVRFTLGNGVVKAKVGANTKTCGTATMLDADTAVLPYLCLLHPWMRGFLLITR